MGKYDAVGNSPGDNLSGGSDGNGIRTHNHLVRK